MTKEEYTKLVLDRYPQYKPLINGGFGFNHIDLINNITKELFLDLDMVSDLSRETRRILLILRVEGVLRWSKE